MRQNRERWLGSGGLALLGLLLGLLLAHNPGSYNLDIGRFDSPFVAGLTSPSLVNGGSTRMTSPVSILRFPGWAGQPAILALRASYQPPQQGLPTTLTLTVTSGARSQSLPITGGWAWYSYTVSSGGPALVLNTPVFTIANTLSYAGVTLDQARLTLDQPDGGRDWLAVLECAGLGGALGWLWRSRWGWLAAGLAVGGLALLAWLAAPLFRLYAPALLIALLLLLPTTRVTRLLRPARWLFAGSLALYLLLGSGLITAADDSIKHYATRLLLQGSLRFPQPAYDLSYNKYGLGHTLAEVPLLALFNLLGGSLPRLHELSMLLISPLAAACTVTLLYHCALLLYTDRRLALALALISGLATTVAAYASSAASEALLTALLLAAIYCLLRYFADAQRPIRWLWLAGAAFSYLVLTKQEYALLAGLAWLWWVVRRKHEGAGWRSVAGQGCALLLPLLGAVALNLGYNLLRTGSLLNAGYAAAENVFVLPNFGVWLNGLDGMLTSSGKSIFRYAPPLLLTIFAAAPFARHWRWEAGLFASSIVVMLLFYARLFYWAGDVSWGPRYLVPLVPLAMLPVGALLAGYGGWTRVGRAVVWLLVAAGVAVQWLASYGVMESAFFRTIGTLTVQGRIRDWQYIPSQSPQLAQWYALLEGAVGAPFVANLSSYGLPSLLDYLVPGGLLAVLVLAARQLRAAFRAAVAA